MLLGVFPYCLAGKIILLSQKLIHCVVYPVVMPLGIGTHIRIALHLLKRTHLLLGRYEHRLHPKAMGRKYIDGIHGHRSRQSLGRQVKNHVAMVLSKRLNRRKQCRNSLTYSRRCLEEQPSLMVDCPVDRSRQVLLTLAVLKGKFQRLD